MQEMIKASLDEAEIAKFTALADAWWDEEGAFKPLHRLNPARLSYIKSALCSHFSRAPDEATPFAGLRLLDIGCGGGLLSEPMCRLGANVLGVDASEANIKTAQIHAQNMGLAIDYQCCVAEDLLADNLSAKGAGFDIILNMEVVEHVGDVSAFLKTCAALLNKDGLMIFSTLNRTLASYALAIIGAEYILRWLPKGTHDWHRFITPPELTDYLALSGLCVTEMRGLSFNPLRDAWRVSDNLSVNYIGAAVHNKTRENKTPAR